MSARRLRGFRVCIGILLPAFGASAGRAQCTPGGPPSPAFVKGAMVGVVMDTAHRTIDGVDVLVRDPHRMVKTDVRGRFTLADLEKRTYEVTVRKIGYEIAVQKIAVTDSGGVARFCLIPEPRALPAMISSVARGGVSGVIGDSTYAVLPGAEVKALAGGAHAITDSAGGFYLDLKPGTFVLTISKKGFGTQFVSVTVPKDSGRQIAVWLASPTINARRVAAALDGMRTRLLFARPNRSKLLSSEDLGRTNMDLHQAVQAASIARVDPTCEAVIDGGPYSLPLQMIDKAEVAAMEVYAGAQPRRTVTSIDPAGTRPSGRAATTGKECPSVYVWLKP